MCQYGLLNQKKILWLCRLLSHLFSKSQQDRTKPKQRSQKKEWLGLVHSLLTQLEDYFSHFWKTTLNITAIINQLCRKWGHRFAGTQLLLTNQLCLHPPPVKESRPSCFFFHNKVFHESYNQTAQEQSRLPILIPMCPYYNHFQLKHLCYCVHHHDLFCNSTSDGILKQQKWKQKSVSKTTQQYSLL